MKHRILFLKFIVTIAIAGSTYSTEESLFDFSSYYSYPSFSSSSSSQLDSKSRGYIAEAESAQSVSAPSHHPTMRLSLETNIDYEHLMFSYLKGVESIVFFTYGTKISIICELLIKDISQKKLDEGRFNLNGEFPVPEEPFRVAYELRKCNKPIAPSVCMCDKNQESLVHPRNKAMQWISAIRLSAVLVGNKIYFTLFGHKYGDSIPAFARSSISLAAPGSLGNNLDLFKALKKLWLLFPANMNLKI